jgi:NAD(P)-dependent dehydrogenase (short-subunit alcohol dehydrogenase family)
VSQPLDGLVALVTGARGGLGRAFCAALAGAGARVAAVDVANPGQATDTLLPLRADVREPDAMRSVCGEAVERFGSLEIVVANAGRYPSTPFDDVTLEEWRELMQLNLDGTFVTVQAALPHLRRAGWGRVVVISSSTVWSGVPTLVPYVTTKAGLIGFTRALATELADTGITVNAITPGLIDTETVRASWVGQQFDWVVESQAVKRRQTPEDLASTLLYLCDPGSEFVTGQTINVDGGMAKH